ncbi:MAG: sigma-70 family RNA polymerase sigma factor [Clostridia bacterium]|nr:sigma-70 family RNA polymerase sigma factor [Clostridia bacterium]
MRYEEYNLEDLFLLAKKGDGTAFEHIVRQTEKQIYNLSLSIVKSNEDAEDLTQETYLRLWRSLPDYKGESAKSYIFRIARNLSIDLIRKRNRTPGSDTVILTADGEFERDIVDHDPDIRPDEAFIRRLTIETVRECISALPPPMRELIVMRDIDGLAYHEIASILEIPEGSVKSRLFRARERLRALIIEKNIL